MKSDDLTIKNIHLITERAKFWASSLDAMLQDMIAAVTKGDGLGTVVASARLTQLSTCLSEEYEAICNALIASDTESKVASQQAVLVTRMVQKNGELILTKVPPPPALVATPDRDLS